MRNNSYQTAMQQLRFDARFAENTAARMANSARWVRKRRLLTIAACLLLAITLVACIPEARAAVGAWFTKVFSAENYMGEESGNRSPEPAMDAVITKVGNDDREIVIYDIHNSDRARALANDFGVRLDEVAYINGFVYISGWFTGASGKFLLDQWTGGDTWSEEGEWLEGNMALTMPNGEIYLGALNPYFSDDMQDLMAELELGSRTEAEQIADMAFDENGNMLSGSVRADALWYAWLNDHDVRFTFEAHKSLKDAAPLSGQVEAALSFQQYYYIPSTDSCVTLFRAELGTVTIDTDAYAANVRKADADVSVTLSGTHRIFVDEWEYRGDDRSEDAYVNYSVHDLDMSDVTITVEAVTFTPTGPEITVRLDLPESWTRTERIAVIRGVYFGGLQLITLVDGKEVEHLFKYQGTPENGAFDDDAEPFFTYRRVLYGSAIPPSGWESVKEITLIPCTSWPVEVSVEDVNSEHWNRQMIALEPGVVVTLHVNHNSMGYDDIREDRMTEHALTIRLDDYR